MTFKPLKDRVLVKRVEKSEMSAGGLYLAPSAQEKPQEAIVVAVGADVTTELQEGDTILLGKYSGTEIKINNEEHVILKEEDILGVFDDNNM